MQFFHKFDCFFLLLRANTIRVNTIANSLGKLTISINLKQLIQAVFSIFSLKFSFNKHSDDK